VRRPRGRPIGQAAFTPRHIRARVARHRTVGTRPVKPRSPRPSQSTFQVTLTIGDETRIITGRAAELVASVALHEDVINATPVGKAVIHFAQGQAQLELRCSFPPLRFQL